MKQKKATSLKTKDKPMKWWYSRVVDMEERDYQVVLKLLKKAAEENPDDKEIDHTLVTFTMGQEAHYTSQEEYYKLKKDGII